MKSSSLKIVVWSVCLLLLSSVSRADNLNHALSRYLPFASQTVKGWNYIREYYSNMEEPSSLIIIPEEELEQDTMVPLPEEDIEEEEVCQAPRLLRAVWKNNDNNKDKKNEIGKDTVQTSLLSLYLQSEVDSLSKKIHNQDGKNFNYSIVPYWMSDVYKHLDQKSNEYLDSHESYLGYVVNPMTGGSLVETNFKEYLKELNYNWNQKNRMELVVMLTGDVYTDFFLRSESSQRNLIYNLFGDSLSVLTHEHVTGVNFYFPDYRFDRPREMAQFVKKVSLVVDSLVDKNDGCYAFGAKEPSHKNLDLHLMFNYEEKAQNYNYISGLQCFVDAIYFADFDEYGLPVQLIKDGGSVDTSSIISRIINPFYLFHFRTNEVDEESRTDIEKILQCDYNSGMCGLFLVFDLVLLLLLVVYFVLNFTSTEMNLWKSVYPTLFVLFPITLITEFIVFFFCFWEALSPQIIFMKIENSYTDVLYLFFLPIIPIIIYLVYQRVKNNTVLP